MLGCLDFILKQLSSLKGESDGILFPFLKKNQSLWLFCEQWIIEVVGVGNERPDIRQATDTGAWTRLVVLEIEER